MLTQTHDALYRSSASSCWYRLQFWPPSGIRVGMYHRVVSLRLSRTVGVKYTAWHCCKGTGYLPLHLRTVYVIDVRVHFLFQVALDCASIAFPSALSVSCLLTSPCPLCLTVLPRVFFILPDDGFALSSS